MSQTSDFDVGPLTWVKSEIDAALDRARECIDKALASDDKREALRFAQTHVHQASGALSVVGLDGVSQYADAIDKLLAAQLGEEHVPSDAHLKLAGRAVAVLANYINELLAGSPHQPLRLLDSYRELIGARGGEAPQASELFFPDLSVRPALEQARDVEAAQAAHELRVMRGRFEKGLLAWIRQPGDPAGPQAMLQAVARIEQLQALPATRAFWWAARAFFEGLAQGVIVADRPVHKVCRRIDTQMRRLIEGSQVVAERLVRDVLYYVATADIESGHAQAVRQVYKLERLLPSPDAHLSDTLRQPLSLRLREAVEQAKEFWNRFIAGAAVALPQFIDQHAEVVARAAPMRMEQVDRLLAAMGGLLGWLRDDPKRANEAVAMEVATGLLVVEQANDSPNADLDLLRRQVDLLVERYAARKTGRNLEALDDSLFGEASRRAQERLFFNQLAREILTNLGQIEQTLDAFFRNSAQREPLAGLKGPLKQIEGAFSMLGESRGAQLVRDSAERVVAFSQQSGDPDVAECDKLAHQLSALGFYVEALKTGPAQLEHFLDPSLVKLPDAEVEAVTDTVEVQLQRDRRDTRDLVEALKESPEDAFLRQQLVSNLEAIREDAHLIADAQLEQQAKEALASLKSGEDVAAAQIEEKLAVMAPMDVPQPSEEAARLMSVSSEELDAELLEIFLEEADEVLETIASHRATAVAEPHNVDALTTVRRGYHTLKGSSRMVGLQDFSEAARHVEATMNRWLQLDKNTSDEIVALIDHGHQVFAAWVEQLHAGQGIWRDASELIAHANRLLSALDVPPDEDPPPGSKASPAAAASSAAAIGSTSATGEGRGPVALADASFDLDMDLAEPVDDETEPFDLPDADLTATSVVDAPRLVEASLTETTFDFGGLDLPELGQSGEAGQNSFETSLSETSLDMPDMAMLAANEETVAPAAEQETPKVLEAEMDLTSSFVGNELRNLEAAEGASEFDLTDTNLDGSVLGMDLGTETSLDGVVLDDVVVPFMIQPVPPVEVPEGDDAMTLAELEAAEAAAGILPEVEQRPPVVASEPAVQVVSIEDELGAESQEDLPRLNLAALGTSPPAPDSMLARVAELSPPEPANDEVMIGGSTMSRTLFGLYIGEAAQHIATLRGEIAQQRASPQHVPDTAAVRAAHTLAGISGTARIEPVQMLGRALEHALHRFADVQRAPDAAQSEAMAQSIEVLSVMLAEVERMALPVAQPELVARLDSLQPHLENEPVLGEPEPFAAPAVESVVIAKPVSAVIAETPVVAMAPEMTDEETDDAEILAEEESSGIQDDLDEQLLPIFFEEAQELSVEIGSVLRQLRADANDNDAMQSLARLFHTLKGSARMAGAMRLGEFVHGLESHLESALRSQKVGAGLVDDLENGIDAIEGQLAVLRDPSLAQPVVPTPAPVAALAHEEPAAPVVAPPVGEAATPVPAAAPSVPRVHPALQPVVLEEAADIVQSQRAMLRVRADLVDRFVNEAGEISIARTRVEGEMRTLRRSLLDLTENVIRLRNQLREVEISAESQMQSRIAAAESLHAEFDPLEFDRFTRLQEVTRMMAESVGDVTTIQQNLLRNLDAADSALHAQGRLSRDLQQNLMGVRMVPFDEMADRLYRVVRQTAKELGKRANLDIRGGSIEIDRGVLDRMTAPIEHLLRNSLAHGIEKPEVRAAAGKGEFGQITISLHQLSNEIALEILDDGQGLNFERILARGRQAGLVAADETPTEGQLTQLIFEPGFSTAETVSGIAGRGVGMDVVKNEALSVGGRIDVASTAGQGARFLIHLPLTLAVTQALLARAADRTYAIPSTMVVQAQELKEGALGEARDRGYVEWKGENYPFRYLPRLLGDTTTQPAQQRFHWVLLLRAGNERLALHIDELRGNQEIVVKNAGPQFVRLQGYTGATVLPDGEIALILNPVVLAGRKQHVADEDSDVAPVADTFEVPTVMVVDDSLTVRKITSRLLEREGFRVITAKDGVDALEQLVEVVPDVALLDIEMPRMDGFDLARNIRADEKLKHLPLIMITSRTADKHRNYAMEIGVNHYLGKPYQEEQLLELITGFIAARRR